MSRHKNKEIIEALAFSHHQYCHNIWVKTLCIDHWFGIIFRISRVTKILCLDSPPPSSHMPSKKQQLWDLNSGLVECTWASLHITQTYVRLGKAKRIRMRTAEGLFSLNSQETMASMEGVTRSQKIQNLNCIPLATDSK